MCTGIHLAQVWATNLHPKRTSAFMRGMNGLNLGAPKSLKQQFSSSLFWIQSLSYVLLALRLTLAGVFDVLFCRLSSARFSKSGKFFVRSLTRRTYSKAYPGLSIEKRISARFTI